MGPVGEVPVEVFTVTGTMPAPGGVVTETDVPDELGWPMTAAGFEPNSTVDPGVNPAPVMVTLSPPLALPEFGLMPVMTGV